ncbi:MAG: AAA family ATPase [Planctomycetota bacterium]|nr:AAA family ATPase [Planctomycetota bacterium]
MQHILGQTRAIETLAAALRCGRLQHAWIFAGPRGVGKFTTAIEFAKILLDPNAVVDPSGALTADPQSETTRLIKARAHPDLHVIYKELALYSENPEIRERKLQNIPLDVLREHMIGGRTGDNRFHEPAVYKTAVLGHGKVFIIDEAELLAYGKNETQNALLKALEEPPHRTYIFLITNRPQRLLLTIRSRCQHVQFTPLDAEAMAAWFQRAALGVDEDERAWIERFCEGSPGMAQLAADYGFCRWQMALEPMLDELQQGSFPTEMGQIMAELIETFATSWVKQHENASKDAAKKDGARHLLAILAAHARRKLASRIDEDEDPTIWLEVIDLLREAERQLDANVNLKLLLENLVVQWAALAAEPVRS